MPQIQPIGEWTGRKLSFYLRKSKRPEEYPPMVILGPKESLPSGADLQRLSNLLQDDGECQDAVELDTDMVKLG